MQNVLKIVLQNVLKVNNALGFRKKKIRGSMLCEGNEKQSSALKNNKKKIRKFARRSFTYLGFILIIYYI